MIKVAQASTTQGWVSAKCLAVEGSENVGVVPPPPGGVIGFDWVWIALAVFADVAMWAGGGIGNRDRIPG